MRVQSKPAWRKGRPCDQRERVAQLTLTADPGEEECFLAWLRRATTEEGPEMLRAAGPDPLYEPPRLSRRAEAQLLVNGAEAREARRQHAGAIDAAMREYRGEPARTEADPYCPDCRSDRVCEACAALIEQAVAMAMEPARPEPPASECPRCGSNDPYTLLPACAISRGFQPHEWHPAGRVVHELGTRFDVVRPEPPAFLCPHGFERDLCLVCQVQASGR